MPKPKYNYWLHPKNAPVHPYVALEGTPLWYAVKGALSALEEKQDLKLTEWHQYVVGYICNQLSERKIVKVSATKRFALVEPLVQPEASASGRSSQRPRRRTHNK